MKTLKRTQMKSFEGATLKELEENFNQVMEWVASYQKHSEPVVDLPNLRGFVTFEETVRIPEGMRDKLDLAGMRALCGDCKNFEPTKYGAGACKFCRGDLRKGDECCERFFKKWDAGECWLAEGKEEEYLEAVNELRLTSIRCSA